MNIDYTRDQLLTEHGKKTLKDRYLDEGETSPQEAFARAAKAFSDDEAHAQRLYDYASKLWFMFSTPVLSNGGTNKGLPISCYLNYVDDSRKGLSEHYDENIWLSSTGGGIGGYWGNVRSDGQETSRGNKTSGILPFMHVVDAQMLAFNQGSTRRGSYASYLDISHPEIVEFIEMRKPSGGDLNRKNLNLHHGINITDEFMACVASNSSYNLVDPNSKRVTETVDARELWAKILEARVTTGEPYLCFIDTANRALPRPLHAAGLKINQSNLCTEIFLPTAPDRTAVCCLSSVNLEKFDEWIDNELFIEDLCRMLDNVLSDFISKAPDSLWRAKASAQDERSIGLGAMGFHSFLQKKRVPFDCAIAASWNKRMFKHIKTKALAASQKLGSERGPAPAMRLTGERFAHLMAVAPNASSSIICGGVSPSIEPIRANVFKQNTMSGAFITRNTFLEEALEEEGLNTPEIWKSIVQKKGSVQHIEDFRQRDVFRTAIEIDQRWIIEHAAARQEFICQGQSVNLFLPSDVERKVLHQLHMEAYNKGLKSLYYLRSEAATRAEVLESVERKTREDGEGTVDEGSDCLMCEG